MLNQKHKAKHQRRKKLTKIYSRKKILISMYLLLKAIILKELESSNECVFGSQG